MKTRSTLLTLLLTLGTILTLHAPRCRAQVAFSPQFTQVTNSTLWVTTNYPVAIATVVTATVTNANAVPLFRGRGVGIWALVGTTNASGSNVVVNLDVSSDSTNWTSGWTSWTFANQGTAGVPVFTNILADKLDNIKFVRVTSVVNVHSATLWVTNLAFSIFP